VVLVKIYFVQGAQQLGSHLYSDNIEIKPGEKAKIDPLNLLISSEIFPAAGKYSIRASMLAMQVTGHKKGEKIDKSGHIMLHME